MIRLHSFFFILSPRLTKSYLFTHLAFIEQHKHSFVAVFLGRIVYPISCFLCPSPSSSLPITLGALTHSKAASNVSFFTRLQVLWHIEKQVLSCVSFLFQGVKERSLCVLSSDDRVKLYSVAFVSSFSWPYSLSRRVKF